MSHMRTRSQGLSTASFDGVLNPVPTPRTRTPTSDGISPNYSLQRPVSVIGRLMDSVSTSSTLREDGGISSQDYLLSTYVPTPRARAASTLDTCSIDWGQSWPQKPTSKQHDGERSRTRTRETY